MLPIRRSWLRRSGFLMGALATLQAAHGGGYVLFGRTFLAHPPNAIVADAEIAVTAGPEGLTGRFQGSSGAKPIAVEFAARMASVPGVIYWEFWPTDGSRATITGERCWFEVVKMHCDRMTFDLGAEGIFSFSDVNFTEGVPREVKPPPAPEICE